MILKAVLKKIYATKQVKIKMVVISANPFEAPKRQITTR